MNLKSYIPFYKRNLQLAVPVMVTQAGQMVVQFADNIMVGHLGTSQFAGVGFANSLFTISMVFCTCFTQGMTPYIGQNYGAGNHRNVSRYFINGMLLDMIMCAAVVALMMWGVIPMMDHMGQDTDILPYAKAYLNINVLSLIPFVLFFAIRNFSEGIGNTKVAMYITVVCNLLNIFLNWVLIYGNLGMGAMGVEGAALATLISRVTMLLAMGTVIFLIHPHRRYMQEMKLADLNRKNFMELVKTSVPISLQGLVETTAFNLSGIMVGWFGAQALAAHQIAYTMISLSFMIAQGVGVAATIRVSHQYGERRFADARKAGFAASHMCVMIMSFAGIAFLLLRNFIPYIFTGDPEVAAIAANLILVAVFFQIFDGTQLAFLADLRALGDVKMPLFLSIIAYYGLCLPAGYFFGKVVGFGPSGVWSGLLLGLMFSAALFLVRFHKLTRNFTDNE